MRTSRLFVLPLLLAACGGSVDSGGSVINNDNNQQQNPQTHLPQKTVAGSFDLIFTKVTATATFSGASNPVVTSPSQGSNARLDVASDAATTAVLTTRWGNPVTLAAAATAANVAMTTAQDASMVPQLGGKDASTGIYVTDRWTSFTFGRTSDGGFDGTFTAKGDEQMFEGDEGFEATLAATGKITLDTTAPELRVGTLPPDGLLPWDAVHVQLAEPPNPKSPIDTILSLDVSNVSNGIVNADPTTLQATALLRSWDVQTASVNAIVFDDLNGNASASAQIPVKYVNTGAPKSAFTFDDTSAPVAFYGQSSSLITTLASDPACESGGCTKIGTISGLTCNVQPSGFAGVLSRSSATAGTLHVRYRILAGIDPAATGNPAILPDGQAFAIEAATPGVLPSTKYVGFASTDLKTIPSTFGYTQATDWTTADVPVAAASQAGFAIQYGSHSCGGGPIFNDNITSILIDSVTVD